MKNLRETHRSILAKLYPTIQDWPVEDKEDYITLHVSEMYLLFTIAKSEALEELYKRFGFKRKKNFLAGIPKSKSS